MITDVSKPRMLRGIPDDLWKKVKVAAAENSEKVSEYVGRILRNQFDSVPAAPEPAGLGNPGTIHRKRKTIRRASEVAATLAPNQEADPSATEYIAISPEASAELLKQLEKIQPQAPTDICAKPLSMMVGHLCRLPKGHEGKCPKK